ncbi:TKL protein kinase [Saprolegnia diclina VS20]|uniref:TKL protein kinase n=1 Tax=Saprolegnia diclina (strain VS20) TaxID=1156394 RepID=T0R6I4_SAPDV|nr:TKL protein kinase [Saprolegnia diclina VS20]EQC25122.1 TKL protein kinase [Saprolegnia diclina VS20]|eukprot:XP_008621447.1 TKL protein kinase [Saprolegnia diclina VS20]
MVTVRVPFCQNLQRYENGEVSRVYVTIRHAGCSTKSAVSYYESEKVWWNVELRTAKGVNATHESTVELQVFEKDAEDVFIGSCTIPVPQNGMHWEQVEPIFRSDIRTGDLFVYIDDSSSANASVPVQQMCALSVATSVQTTASTTERSAEPSPQSPEPEAALDATPSLDIPDSITRYDASMLDLTAEPIGKGAFGHVCISKLGNATVAVKTFHKKGNYQEAFKKEVNIMHRLNSPFMPKLIGISNDKDDQPCIIMELMDGGNLEAHLQRLSEERPTPRNVERLVRIALQVAKCLVYLHGKGIIDRDVKPANIFLDEYTIIAKLGDMGISREQDLDKTMTNGIGTPTWVAPEVMLGLRYTVAADIFALGIILTQISSRKVRPYAGHTFSGYELHHQIARHGYRPSMGPDCPTWLVELATACMSADPSQRPTAAEVVQQLEAHLALPQLPDSDLLDRILVTSSQTSRVFQSSVNSKALSSAWQSCSRHTRSRYSA